MRRLRLIAIAVLFLLLAGCSSSFDDCNYTCKRVNRDDFKYQEMVCYQGIEQVMKDIPCEEKLMTKTNYTALSKHCFERCTPGEQ